MEARHIVWDSLKAIENKEKHHVSFEDVLYVFSDPRRIERRDDSEGNTSGEDRWQTVGKVDRVYFVVYTERTLGDDEQTRLISARLANKPERRIYHGIGRKNDKGWTKAD
ncbi:hypothetical protein FACS189445_1800 [Spirochaetia bacterium]|nr:hypothetical protein FACS189445_1800 [Spirochaetia bacterium]